MDRANGSESVDGWDSNRFQGSPRAIRNGVPSWTTVEDPPRTTDANTLSTIVDAMQGRSTREAATVALENAADGGYAARNALFVDPADAWRLPVAAEITGRCLDVHAGVGTRALLLAELADTVDAVGTALDALTFLARRDDYASADRVTPVHADIDSLPPPSEPYDTVVADLTGANRPDSLPETVRALTEHLSPDGTVLLLLDGWARLAGVTDAVEAVEPSADGDPDRTEATRALVRGYDRRLTALGFDDVELYGMIPGLDDPSYVVPIDDAAAVRRLLATSLANDAGVGRTLALVASAVHAFGVLGRCWPAYVAVCRAGDDGSKTEPDTETETGTSRNGSAPIESFDASVDPDVDGLVRRGDGRSTVFHGADESLSGITRIPHRRAHADFVLDERRTIRRLREHDPDEPDPPGLGVEHDPPTVPGTVPSGSVTMTRFGPTSVEEPPSGAPLSGLVTADPDGFRRVLELGFDWITRLQRRYGGRPARWSSEVVREDLSVPELGLDPPGVGDPVRLFRCPCHGRLGPANVFVARGGRARTDTPEASGSVGGPDFGPVTAVVDWEFGSVADNAVTDPSSFALRTADLAFGGLSEGIDAAFATPGPHADAVRAVVSDYCSAVGIGVDDFLTYLPVAWIRRLRRCAARGATASYSGRAIRRVKHVRLLRERREEIAAVIGSNG